MLIKKATTKSNKIKFIQNGQGIQNFLQSFFTFNTNLVNQDLYIKKICNYETAR